MSKASGVEASLITEDGDKSHLCHQLPGSFYYVNHGRVLDVGFIHSCPCGCGILGHINLSSSMEGPIWVNSGSREKPTLTPSVGIKPFREDHTVEADGFHWHGWLKDGVWNSV